MRRVMRSVLTGLAVASVVFLAGCSADGFAMSGVADVEGVTQSEAEQMSTQERFERFGKQYATLQGIMTEAQLQVSDGTWEWGDAGFIGAPGTFARYPLQGANDNPQNSYFLRTSRYLFPESAAGASADLQPMIDYFEEQKWEYTLDDSRTSYYAAVADTGDGYFVEYTVQANGQCNLEVFSAAFWGEHDDVSERIAPRTSVKDQLKESVPGVYVPFPEWDGPILSKTDYGTWVDVESGAEEPTADPAE